MYESIQARVDAVISFIYHFCTKTNYVGFQDSNYLKLRFGTEAGLCGRKSRVRELYKRLKKREGENL